MLEFATASRLVLRQPSLASASIRAGSRGYSRTRFGKIYAVKHGSNVGQKNSLFDIGIDQMVR